MGECRACLWAVAVTYQYEAYAGFHVIQLHTEGAPILLFSDPMAIPNSHRGTYVRRVI